ncbi:KpsF/GutQ family sugar-phosphate isomerase [Paracoccaceae bacterium]|nr:KpsF/GutQ family sugar-phosphate isomerase [Paracoccaceae bacterium]
MITKSLTIARRVLKKESEALEILANNLPEDFSISVARIIKCEGRVIISGIGKSGHIGRKLSATLASTGTPSFFVHAAETGHGDLGIICENDICIILSNSGETAELKDLVAYAQRFAVPIIGISANSKSTLMKAATYRLTLPKVPEACLTGLVPTTSTTLMLALGDALAVALMEHRNFRSENFHAFHPGGKLGSKLTTVEQLMQIRNDLAIVQEVTPMKEVLIEMTSSSFGVALVEKNGSLVGIITDGDLRRHVKDLFTKTASMIATPHPGTMHPSDLASKALHLMQARKSYSLAVTDERHKVVGLVRMHDLLKAGIV